MTRKHRNTEKWAMIAQILGGIGSGIAGIQKQREDRAERKTQAERQQQQDELSRRREERLAALGESEMAKNYAQADEARAGKKGGLTPNQSIVLMGRLRQNGIDPSSPTALDDLKKRIEALSKDADQYEEGFKDPSNMSDASILGRKRENLEELFKAAEFLRSSTGGAEPGARGAAAPPASTTGRMGAAAPAPRAGSPGMTAVDERMHGDMLGATGALIGGMQGGADLLSPLFAAPWAILQKSLGIQPPIGIQMQQQGMDPTGRR